VCAALKFVRIRSDAPGVLSFEPTDPLGVGFPGLPRRNPPFMRTRCQRHHDDLLFSCEDRTPDARPVEDPREEKHEYDASAAQGHGL
jgi:hypothetical protein